MTIGARACHAMAMVNRMRFKRNATPIGRRFTEHERGARRRIHLHAVMHLDDFDIEFGSED